MRRPGRARDDDAAAGGRIFVAAAATMIPVVVAIVDTGFGVTDVPRRAFAGEADFSSPVAAARRVGGARIADRHGAAVANTILRHAPDTRLFSIRVFGEQDSPTDVDTLSRAFAWLETNFEHLGIGLVCATVGDNKLHGADWEFGDCEASASLRRLKANGVAVIAPAGNRPARNCPVDRAAQGMMWPAILREAISVAALGPDGLLDPASCWLASTGPGLCGTVTTALPEAPGGTCGAAAVVAGQMAASLAAGRALSPEEALRSVAAMG